MDFNNVDMDLFNVDAAPVRKPQSSKPRLSVQESEDLDVPEMSDYDPSTETGDEEYTPQIPRKPTQNKPKKPITETADLSNILRKNGDDSNFVLDLKNPDFAAHAKERSGSIHDLMANLNSLGVNDIVPRGKGGNNNINPDDNLSDEEILENVKLNINATINSLKNPEEWLPKGKENLAQRLKELKIVKETITNLNAYIKFLEKF